MVLMRSLVVVTFVNEKSVIFISGHKPVFSEGVRRPACCETLWQIRSVGPNLGFQHNTHSPTCAAGSIC